MNEWRRDRTSTRPRLSFWRSGESGPPVLLLMGFGMRGQLWRPQIRGLEADHRVLWCDNRGVGESERGRARFWTMRDMAQDALRVMDAAGFETAHVVGVSMGGMIAQELALAEPSRCRSLTLIATHEGGGLTFLPSALGIREFLRANLAGGEARVEALRKLLYPPEFLATVDEEALSERIGAQVGKPVPRETLLGQLSAVLRHDTGARLHHLSMPTLIMKPTRDVLVPPKRSDRLRRRIAHARLRELEGAGHGALFQSAEEVNEALRRHFADAEATRIARRPTTVHA